VTGDNPWIPVGIRAVEEATQIFDLVDGQIVRALDCTAFRA